MYNNFRVYGTILLLIMTTIVSIGVAFVSKFAAIALACVIFSIAAILIGILVNINGKDDMLYVNALHFALFLNARQAIVLCSILAIDKRIYFDEAKLL